VASVPKKKRESTRSLDDMLEYILGVLAVALLGSISYVHVTEYLERRRQQALARKVLGWGCVGMVGGWAVTEFVSRLRRDMYSEIQNEVACRIPAKPCVPQVIPMPPFAPRACGHGYGPNGPNEWGLRGGGVCNACHERVRAACLERRQAEHNRQALLKSIFVGTIAMLIPFCIARWWRRDEKKSEQPTNEKRPESVFVHQRLGNNIEGTQPIPIPARAPFQPKSPILMPMPAPTPVVAAAAADVVVGEPQLPTVAAIVPECIAVNKDKAV
jgi:hypothetical protein